MFLKACSNMDSLEYEFQDIAGRLGFEPVLAIDGEGTVIFATTVIAR